MQRLRSTWLALVGGAFLLALSVSAAFGAPPTGDDAPRGQTVAAFVHELVFGEDEETDEVADETENETEDDTEDDAVSEVVDSGGELTDPETEDVEAQVLEGEREVPEPFENHGECVSAAAQDEEGFEESDAANHGEWVSDHARYVCWGLEVPGAETEDDVTEGDTEGATDATLTEDDSDADADELSAKEERKAEKAAAREARMAEKAAAKAARAAARGGRGGGH